LQERQREAAEAALLANLRERGAALVGPAQLFDPLLAVHTSLVRPAAPPDTGRLREMVPRQPLC
jgi:hypothetical protein